ncbi:MAG: Rrf2 family transcriptional regulator [Candidatus Hydrothermarchaeales archaeon]
MRSMPFHNYLSKIMRDLVTGGLAKSRIICKGGFSLARPGNAINLKEIYEAVERPLVLMGRLKKGKDYCSYYSTCTQISIWEKAKSLLANYLVRLSVGDITDHQGLREWLVSVHG